MRPKSIKAWHMLVVLAVAGVALTLISWDRKQDSTMLDHQQVINDTTPKKNQSREKKVRDLDEALEELNEVDVNIEVEKAMKEVNEALKNINPDKLSLEIKNAMKEVDISKIMADVEKSMKQLDFSALKMEIDNSLKEVDFEKISRDVQESMAKIDWNELKTELEKLKKIDMSDFNREMRKVEEELKDLGPKLKEEMAKAKAEVEKAKATIQEYKHFVDGLEKDGLLDKKANYKIEHKNGELMVNGKKVAADIYSKYRSFLEKHEKFTIKKTDDDFDFDDNSNFNINRD